MVEHLKDVLRATQEAQQLRAAIPDGELHRALQANMKIKLEIAKQQIAAATVFQEHLKSLRAAGLI